MLCAFLLSFWSSFVICHLVVHLAGYDDVSPSCTLITKKTDAFHLGNLENLLGVSSIGMIYELVRARLNDLHRGDF